MTIQRVRGIRPTPARAADQVPARSWRTTDGRHNVPIVTTRRGASARCRGDACRRADQDELDGGGARALAPGTASASLVVAGYLESVHLATGCRSPSRPSGVTLRLRDERDAAWYGELIGERGEDRPTLEEATTRLAQIPGSHDRNRDRCPGDLSSRGRRRDRRTAPSSSDVAAWTNRRSPTSCFGGSTDAAMQRKRRKPSWKPRPRRVDTGSGRPCGHGMWRHSGCSRRSGSAGTTPPRMTSAMWSTWYATSRAPVRRSHDRQ